MPERQATPARLSASLAEDTRAFFTFAQVTLASMRRLYVAAMAVMRKEFPEHPCLTIAPFNTVERLEWADQAYVLICSRRGKRKTLAEQLAEANAEIERLKGIIESTKLPPSPSSTAPLPPTPASSPEPPEQAPGACSGVKAPALGNG